MIKILCASLGILAVSRLPTLPMLPQPGWLSMAVIATAITLLFFNTRTRWLACFCVGAVWAIVAGHGLLAQQLPPELEGEELLVTGVVSDLPENRGEFQRFEFTISEYHNLNPDFARRKVLPERVLLSWYGQQSLRVAQQWTLRVKLSRPRGFVNSGGFDYQRWLLSRGLGATGYVRASIHNELQGLVPGYPVQERRQAIRDWIAAGFDEQIAGLLRALAVGDTSGISTKQWDLLRGTGTSHLMAISGLHIGLVALLGFWLGHGIRAGLSLLHLRLSWGYWLPGFVSCILAGLYSAMAGFALPTQRALTMVLLVNIALLASRGGSSMRALAWAMLIVLLIDPLSGYDLGFWLSFGAVGFLLFHFQHRYRAGGQALEELNGRSRIVQRMQGLASFGRAQWVVFVGLMVPLLALNQPLSLVTPLANLVAIPLVSFFVVAPLLCGLVLNFLGFAVASAFVLFASKMLGLCLVYLEWLAAHVQFGTWSPQGAELSIPALLLGAAGVLLLLSPRGLPARWLGLLLLTPLVLPSGAERPPLTLTVLDVGQGLATVVSTGNRVVVFDTGPAYSERFNAGDAILGPHLRARGIHKIDRLIISHGDADHAGGAEALLTGVAAGEVVGGEALPGIASAYPNMPVSVCDENSRWEWDGVLFELIEPIAPVGSAPNDQSCVLLVEYAGQRILIPGDIEARVEQTLLLHDQLPEDVSVVVAPHHGSATSSTQGFVEGIQAEHVVYSAGYRSRYGHPHPQVRARYEALGSKAYNTAESGQLSFSWDRRGNLHVSSLRQTQRRYWFD